MSLSEAEQKFLPTTVKEEIQFVVGECVIQFRREKTLLHYQRLNLFRALVSYMHDHASPPLPERYITNISVHIAAQAIMDLDDLDAREMQLSIEPWKGEYLNLQKRMRNARTSA